MSAPPPGVQPKGIRIERGRAVTLHPMGVGETLDAAFKLYRSAWKIFVGAAAIILVPLNFIQAFLTRSNLGSVFNVNEPRATPSNTALGATALCSLALAGSAFAAGISNASNGSPPDTTPQNHQNEPAVAIDANNPNIVVSGWNDFVPHPKLPPQVKQTEI